MSGLKSSLLPDLTPPQSNHFPNIQWLPKLKRPQIVGKNSVSYSVY
jgi:hypothetical protein